jgi:hypothetical protein
MLRDRTASMCTRFTALQLICRDKTMRPIFIKALPPLIQSILGATPVAVAASVDKFLGDLDAMIEDSFLVPLRKIAAQPDPVSDVPSLLGFLQDVHRVCSSVIVAEGLLFSYRMESIPHVVDRRTGEVTLKEPVEYNLTLLPFRAGLDALEKTAKSTLDTISHWKKQIDASKAPFLEYLAASTNASASRLTIWIQLLAITVAVSWSFFFLTFGDPFGIKRENAALRAEVERLQAAEGVKPSPPLPPAPSQTR